jgi:hypothetical protein
MWWDNGPHSAVVQRTAAEVNKMHVYYETKYPGDFRNNEDFVFVLCYFAAGLHIVRERCGLPGYCDKMKTAAWKFWSEMARHFLLAGDGDAVTCFPADFDGILAFIAEVEGRGWTHNEHGPELVERAVTPFVTRYFPRPLHGVGRALVLGIAPDRRLLSLGVTPATHLQKWFAREFVRVGIWLSEVVLPDPQLTLLERYELQAARHKTPTYYIYIFTVIGILIIAALYCRV